MRDNNQSHPEEQFAAGVTSARGFRAGAAVAGIKPSGKPDVAVVLSEGPQCAAAAVFTRNKVVAAPVKYTRRAVANGRISAVVFNSGNANACTGAQGDADAQAMAREAAQALGIDAGEVAVCSTGLIGEELPLGKVTSGIRAAAAAASAAGGASAAEAIMTTDTVPKQAVVRAGGWTVGAMGKGVGMMAPSLATMLVCLCTDADVSAEALQAALQAAADKTFNTLDIDGSTSTNDTVIILANGASGVEPTQAELDTAVLEACGDLADQLQADAEGVTKRIRIEVAGAANDEQALAAARTIGRDNLFKCAMFGSDPNWGRVLAAVGMAEADMDPDNISVTFNGHQVCARSAAVPGAREVDLSGEDIAVHVDLGTGGPGGALVRTTDLSHAYVEINSAYST